MNQVRSPQERRTKIHAEHNLHLLKTQQRINLRDTLLVVVFATILLVLQMLALSGVLVLSTS